MHGGSLCPHPQAGSLIDPTSDNVTIAMGNRHSYPGSSGLPAAIAACLILECETRSDE